MNVHQQWTHRTGGCSGVFLRFLKAALRFSKAGHHSTQKASEISWDYVKLSWKSTTCVSWPSILIDPNRIAGGLNFSPPAADPCFKLSKSGRAEARQWSIVPYLRGIASYISIGRDSVEP